MASSATRLVGAVRRAVACAATRRCGCAASGRGPARRGSSSTLRCAGSARQFAAALRRAVASSATRLVDAALRRAAMRLAAALRRAVAAR
jgi:hypothetical protein